MPVENKAGKPTLEDEEGPDASLRKLLTSRGVQCYCVLNRSGIPIKAAGMEHTESLQYASLLSELTLATQQFLASSQHLLADVADTTSPSDTAGPLAAFSSELVSLRLKSTQHELIVTPDDNYTLIVLHNPNVGAGGAGGAAVAGAVAGEVGGAEGEKKAEAKKPAAEEKESSD